MENFKLMQIIPSMNSGGVEKGTIDVSTYLSENNYINYIASSGGQLLNFINDNRTKHIKLPINSKNFFRYPFIANKLQKNINHFGINIVHVRSRSPAWLLPFISRKNIFTVSTFHNVYGNNNLIKYYYNKQMGNVDSIVAISNYVKKEIIKQYSIDEKKITVINRGCDTDFFNSENVKKDQIQNFLLNYKKFKDKRLILFPGRLTSWKGQLEFLEVVENFKENDLLFVFVGDGKNKSFKNKLLNKIKEKNLNNFCYVIDHMNYDHLRTMYYLSTIIISAPLKPEGFGRIISESLSMKKIVLAYNFGGAKDQLNDLNNIYKIEPHNKEILINRIKKVLEFSQEEYLNLSNDSRSYVCKFFSKENMLSKYFDLYLKL